MTPGAWNIVGTIIAAVVWTRRNPAPRAATSIEESGGAPSGSRAFLEALCSVMGWGGCVVAWKVGRIPWPLGGAYDARTVNEVEPRIECRSDATWRALLAHEAAEVERMRAGQDGEPSAARCDEILSAVLARLA